jgi:hypothetical protein
MSASEDRAYRTVETVVKASLTRLSIAAALGASIAAGLGGWSAASAQQGVMRAQSDAVGNAVERRAREAQRPRAEAPQAGESPATDSPPPANPLPPRTTR